MERLKIILTNTNHILTKRKVEDMGSLTYSALVGYKRGWYLPAILTTRPSLWLTTIIHNIKHLQLNDGVYRNVFCHLSIPDLKSTLDTRPR
jgi:hypothetical protein